MWLDRLIGGRIAAAMADLLLDRLRAPSDDAADRGA
jgi:hypothetical protein